MWALFQQNLKIWFCCFIKKNVVDSTESLQLVIVVNTTKNIGWFPAITLFVRAVGAVLQRVVLHFQVVALVVQVVAEVAGKGLHLAENGVLLDLDLPAIRSKEHVQLWGKYFSCFRGSSIVKKKFVVFVSVVKLYISVSNFQFFITLTKISKEKKLHI